MQYGVTEQGFVPMPYTVILEEILSAYETAYPGFRRHESNALYIQAQAAANREEKFWSVLEATYNSKFVITASGHALELRVVDTIGPRLSPKYALGVCKVIATAGTKIPQGSLINRVDGAAQYRTTKEYVAIDSSAFEITVQATTAGEIGNTVSGTIRDFANTIIGVQSIYNDEAILGGSDAEDDDSLKARFYASLTDMRGSNIPAISARIRATSVNAYKLRENRKKVEDTIEGVLMPPHSIAATVIGGEDSEVANALFHTKAGGIDIIGDTEVPVQDVDGSEYKIKFTRASGAVLYVVITVKVDYTFLPGYETKIKQQALDFINQLRIDETLDYNLLVARSFDGVSGVRSLDLTVGRNSNPTDKVDIVPSPNEKFITELTKITVSITRG